MRESVQVPALERVRVLGSGSGSVPVRVQVQVSVQASELEWAQEWEQVPAQELVLVLESVLVREPAWVLA